MIRISLLGFSGVVFLATSAVAQTYSIGSNPQGSLAYSTAAGIARVAN